MVSLFNSASIKTKVSVNYRKFQSAEIIFQIIYANELNNIKTIFILRDLKNIKGSLANPEFLVIGYFGEELVPVNIDESVKTLELLLSYSKSELLNIGLSVDSIIQAIDFLKKVEIVENLAYYKLSSNINALIRQTGEIKNFWNLELCSKHGVKLKFESFYFIGSKSNNDYILFNILVNNLDYNEINKMHLSEDFYINVDSGKGFRKEYTAVCIKLEKIGEIIKLYFSSLMNSLQKTSMGFLEATKVNSFRLMHLILRSAGLEEENINIEGLDKNKKFTYTVTVLIKNLVINESFGLGLVSFYPPENQYEIFDSFSEQLKKETENLDGKYCWARTHVKSDNLFDAYKSGRRNILQSIDILSSVVRDDYLFDFYTINNKISNWDRDNATPKLVVTTISNIYNNLSYENVTIDFQNIFEPSILVINTDILEKLKQIAWAELFLFNDQKMNDTVQPLISSIKWLNKSWCADNINDKVIYCSIAMEFMIAGEPSDAIYSEKILEEIKEKLKDIKCIDINRILNSIKQPSFMMKLNSMISKLNIPISKNDLDLLNKIRNERNRLFHGSRECEIQDLEIELSNNIVFMIVIKKLYSLKDCQ